jgi:hypothetical protein
MEVRHPTAAIARVWGFSVGLVKDVGCGGLATTCERKRGQATFQAAIVVVEAVDRDVGFYP